MIMGEVVLKCSGLTAAEIHGLEKGMKKLCRTVSGRCHFVGNVEIFDLTGAYYGNCKVKILEILEWSGFEHKVGEILTVYFNELETPKN
jgi:hypothetical protein